MSTQTWNYKHDADITFGEVHVSKLPKIILIFTLIGIVVIGVTIFLFKDYIYDYTNNPQLQFNDKVTLRNDGKYEVDYEISNSAYFKPEAYMEDATYDKETNTYNVSDDLPYEYKIEGDDITTQTEVGQYTISYLSRNRATTEQKDLIVNLKDTTPPTITFELSENADYHVELDKTGSCQLTLIRGKDTTNFDPRKYIKSITDNYTKDDYFTGDDAEKDGHVIYPKNISFINDTVDIIYQATDEAGNNGTASLKLIIKEDVDKIKEEQEKALKEAEAEKKRLEAEKKKAEDEKKKLEEEKKKLEDSQADKTTTQSSGNHNGNGGYSQQPAYTTQQPAVTQPPATTQATTTTTEKPSIRANDVKVSIKEGEDAIVQKCINNVIFRGAAGTAQPFGMPGYDCQLAVGTYTITWKTNTGLSCTQKLTITE